MEAISLSVTVRFTLLGAVLVALSIGFAYAQGSGDESKLRDLAGRASGYTAEVRDLLARGVNPNVPDSRGRTAVHVAAGIGAVETLAALLQAYGDSDAQDTDGNTPLHLAADASSAVLSENDSIATIRLLLDHQAEPNRANRNGETPLHLAARSHDRPDGVAALLDAGANPNRADRRNDTPLHAALGPNRGESGIVGALLDGGANPAAVNTDGLTPLLLFVRHGPDRGDTVARLLRAGADPDRKDPGGEAPLHIAIRTGGNRGKVDAAEALLAGGADPCVRDAQGFIPYSVAAEGGPIHQALDRAGGYDRACDGRGETITLDPDQRRRIQTALADAGFDPGPADGQFGPKTHRAIEAWQEAAGYAVTGELTSEQVEMLLANSVPGPATAVALAPKCTGAAEGTECWKEIADKPGCHVWDDSFRPDQTVTWSGPCSGGIADGQGGLVWTRDGKSVEQTGSLSDGKKEGRWTIRYANGTVMEGTFVDGKHNGHWVLRYADGRVHDGMAVDGKKNGRWTERGPDGDVDEGSYVDGERDGHWVERWGDSNDRAVASGTFMASGTTYLKDFSGRYIRWADAGVSEGPYVDGKKHGHWVIRWTDGTVIEGPYLDGKEHGHWIVRWADGGVSEGPYVDGKEHGHWVMRSSDGNVTEGSYVDGLSDGHWVSRWADGLCITTLWSRRGGLQTQEGHFEC